VQQLAAVEQLVKSLTGDVPQQQLGLVELERVCKKLTGETGWV